jgi:hypothetical protein
MAEIVAMEGTWQEKRLPMASTNKSLAQMNKSPDVGQSD